MMGPCWPFPQQHLRAFASAFTGNLQRGVNGLPNSLGSLGSLANVSANGGATTGLLSAELDGSNKSSERNLGRGPTKSTDSAEEDIDVDEDDDDALDDDDDVLMKTSPAHHHPHRHHARRSNDSSRTLTSPSSLDDSGIKQERLQRLFRHKNLQNIGRLTGLGLTLQSPGSPASNGSAGSPGSGSNASGTTTTLNASISSLKKRRKYSSYSIAEILHENEEEAAE